MNNWVNLFDFERPPPGRSPQGSKALISKLYVYVYVYIYKYLCVCVCVGPTTWDVNCKFESLSAVLFDEWIFSWLHLPHKGDSAL